MRDDQGIRWEGVKNDSNEVCPPFGLLAISDDLEMRGENFKRPVLVGDKPSTTFYRRYAVNGPTAIPAGGYGRCTFGPGNVIIAYDTGTPANGEGWGPKPGQWTASKGFPGISVVGIHNSTKKRLVGTLSPITTLLCKATASISADSVASGNKYDILAGTLGSETDAGFTTVPDFYNPGVEIATDDLIWLQWGAGNGWIGGKIC